MAIRAFITTWTLIDGQIHNPIVDHIDTQPDMGIICSMVYGDADANGLPDKAEVLVLVESNQVSGHVLEKLGNIQGVTLIPGQRPEKAIKGMPPSVRADIDGLVSAHKIPQSVVTGATSFGDMLRAMEKYISPNANGVTTYIAKRPTEFG